LDLGGRFDCPERYISVDLLDADVNCDLSQTWPFDDDSVGVLRAYHLIEHLPNPIHFFNEAYRVLAPGGLLLLEVPSMDGPGGVSDPTHRSFFNRRSFEYYTDERKARYIRPEYTGAFQLSRLNQYAWPDGVIVISVQMIALKGWYERNFCGEKLISLER